MAKTRENTAGDKSGRDETEKEEARATVGERPELAEDSKYVGTAPGTDPNAPAPLAAEHLDDPADAYKQDPPPQAVGPAAAREPQQVVTSTPHAPQFDSAGMPVNPPPPSGDGPGNYQSGEAPADAE